MKERILNPGRCKPIFFLLSCLIFFLPGTADSRAANLSVTEFELITRGYIENQTRFVLSSIGNFDMEIDGGSKFGGNLGFNFSGKDLENLPDSENKIVLDFASASIRSIFSLPVDVRYFHGSMENLCSGEEFPALFGSRPITTQLKGFFYFPDGIQYNGIHQINGTGMNVSTQFGSDSLALEVYGYQDGYLDPEVYSADARFLYNSENLKLELSGGGTWPQGALGAYRTGMLLYLSAQDQGAFYAQIGIPRWEGGSPLDQNLFYFLIEPRIYFGSFALIPTLFRHPAYYNNTETQEESSTDVNINLRYGDLNTTGLTGGLEGFININSSTAGSSVDEQLRLKLSPYLSFVETGSIWTFKINFQIYPYSITELVEPFIGVKAEY